MPPVRGLLCCALASIVTGLFAGQAAAADILGVWQSPSRGAHIQIAHCGDNVCGKLLSASRPRSNPQLLDVHNKNPALRDRPMIGQIVFDGFRGGPEKWTGGKLYNPGDGNFYHGTLTLLDEGHLLLKGCVFGFLCKSQTWTKVE